MPVKRDVVVIGAGAAGMMCAIEVAKRGRSVVVIDHSKQIGTKILVSGGGRCNFTNIDATAERYVCANPNFPRSALARYSAADFVSLVEKHGIAWNEKKAGQLFCNNSARDIVKLLVDEAAAAGVEIRLACRIERLKKGDRFLIETSADAYESSSVVIATGGLSVPKLGATGFAHQIARQFGIGITEPRPGLAPLTLSQIDMARLRGLSGVSLKVRASCGEVSFHENMLFTHRGLSGPAILQISSYWRPGMDLSIDLLPDLQGEEFLRAFRSGMKTGNWLSQRLPRRFVEAWLDPEVAGHQVDRLPRDSVKDLAEALHEWKVFPSGTEGYAKAEVTVGGVDTAFLSSKTMEARNVRGLFFVGEAVDVTGWLGGYNFQWAWSSGWAAGQFA